MFLQSITGVSTSSQTLGGLQLTEERIYLIANLSFLKELKLFNRPTGYPEDLRFEVKAHLSKVDVRFQ